MIRKVKKKCRAAALHFSHISVLLFYDLEIEFAAGALAVRLDNDVDREKPFPRVPAWAASIEAFIARSPVRPATAFTVATKLEIEAVDC